MWNFRALTVMIHQHVDVEVTNKARIPNSICLGRSLGLNKAALELEKLFLVYIEV